MAYNEHLRKLWVAKGYSSDMGSAAVVPPPPDSFRRLYHLTSAEYAITNIVFGRLKVARFSSLNDPFELLAHVTLRSHDRLGLLENKNRLNQEYGLLCFSENWTDPALWAHYGDRHRGICLGFDVEDGFARKITYQKARLKDDDARDKSEAEVLDALLYTKYESWQYEREWRLLLNLSELDAEGGLHFRKFGNRLKLTEVVVGAECSISFDEIRKLASTHCPMANTVKTRMARGSFDMVPLEKTIIAVPG
jgi:hypothetical protein